MNNSAERILHTGLFSVDAVKIFKDFFSYSKHNSSTHRLHRAFSRLKVSIAPDGEVLISTVLSGGKDEYGNLCYGTSFWDHTTPEKSKVWIAVRMKQHVIESMRSDGAWRRNNESKVKEIAAEAATINAFYLIYDILLNRKKLEKKYDSAVYTRIVGVKRDPMIAEMEINRRNEVARINREYAEAKTNAAAKRRRLYDEYYKKLLEDEENEVAAAKKKHDDEITALTNAMQAILAANGLVNDSNGSVSNLVQY